MGGGLYRYGKQEKPGGHLVNQEERGKFIQIWEQGPGWGGGLYRHGDDLTRREN